MRTGVTAGKTADVAVGGSASGDTVVSGKVVDSGEVVGIGGCVQAPSEPPTMPSKTRATVNVQCDRFIIAAHCTPFVQSCTAHLPDLHAGLRTLGSNDDSHNKSVLVTAQFIFNCEWVSVSPFWIIDKANQRPAIRVLFILLNINN